MNREDFLASRQLGIGGSDAGTIMGVNPYKTAHELYLEKRGELGHEDLDYKLPIRAGKELENFVAKEYEAITGFKVMRFNKQLQHPDYPWMLGNLDRIVSIDGTKPSHKGELRTSRLLECKTALGRLLDKSQWGESGSDEVPETYFLQCMHYLAVSGADQIDLAVLLAGPEIRIYHIIRDEELIKSMIIIEEGFWERVKTGTPPDVEYDHRATKRMLDRLYPGTDGSTIDLPDSTMHWHNVLNEAKEQIKAYEQVATGAKNHLLHLMGEAATGKLPDGSIYTRKITKRKAFSVDAAEYIDFRHSKPKD